MFRSDVVRLLFVVGRLLASDAALRPSLPGDRAVAFTKLQQLVVYIQDGRHVNLDSSQQEGTE